ncbi:hypothetical protein ACKWTF_016332 [Chironomus riparius]
MCFVKVFVTFSCITFTGSSIEPFEATEEALLSKMISDICEEFFIKESIEFNVIVYGRRTRHFDDILDEFLRLNSENFLKNVQHVENVFNWNHKFEDSAVILLHELEDLRYLNAYAKFTNQLPKTLKFLIYCQNDGNLLEASKLQFYKSDSPDISSFEFFIVNENSTIELKTFDYFMDNACNQRSIRILNSFNKTTENWTKKLKNYRNFENFNGCMLTCTDEYNVYLHLDRNNSELIKCVKSDELKNPCFNLFLNILSNSNIGYRGITYEIFEILGKLGNFTTNYQFSDNNYIISKSKTIIYQAITIFKVGQFKELSENTHMSSIFFDIPVGIFISPPEFYTNFEKLLLPFDAMTWIFLGIMFITTTTFLAVMRLMPVTLRNIFYGEGIQTPGLNVIKIFFGIGQTKLPNESILRFFLILFVMFCLIMRTCYQSKMFDFITSDMRKPPPKTLEEVIEHGYTIVLLDYSALYHTLYNEVRMISRTAKVQFVFESERLERLYCSSIHNSSDKLAFFLPTKLVNSYSSSCHGSLAPIKNFHMNTIPGAFAMTKNSILYPYFEDVMEKLIPSGIPQYLPDFHAFLLYGNYKNLDMETLKVLTLDDLSFGFILWLIACAISMIGFLIEIVFASISKAFKSVVGLILLLQAIKRF